MWFCRQLFERSTLLNCLSGSFVCCTQMGGMIESCWGCFLDYFCFCLQDKQAVYIFFIICWTLCWKLSVTNRNWIKSGLTSFCLLFWRRDVLFICLSMKFFGYSLMMSFFLRCWRAALSDVALLQIFLQRWTSAKTHFFHSKRLCRTKIDGKWLFSLFFIKALFD